MNGFLNPPYDNQASVYLRWRLATGSQTADGVYIDEVVVRCRRVSYAAGNEFANPSGTSMASPHVAGAAALAFAKIPGASVAAVKDAILEGVDQKPALSGLVATGGRLNLNGMLTRLTAGLSAAEGRDAAACAADPRIHAMHIAQPLPWASRPAGRHQPRRILRPAVQLSAQLTVGTPDATPSGPAANSVGFLKASTVIGNPVHSG